MNDAPLVYESSSEADTARLGRRLAEVLPHGVMALDGPLGAGKTRLVQAIAESCGVDPRDVVSPTFVLVHEYRGGTRPIIHIDAYRLRDEDEFLQMGADEYYQPPNLVLIEWASRIARALPDERLEVTIEVLSDSARRVTLRAHGPRESAALARLRDGLATRD